MINKFKFFAASITLKTDIKIIYTKNIVLNY